MASSADALKARVVDPGYTPSVRTLGSLLDLLRTEDDDVAKHVERAVLRIELQYATRVVADVIARVGSAERPARGRLARLAGRLAREGRDPDGAARAWLASALTDDDRKTRRAAARALGGLAPTPEVERALIAAWDGAKDEDDLRALALALGKVGSEAARARLDRGGHARASVIADREIARRTKDEIDLSRAPGEPLRIWFHTRSGLEPVLEEELGRSFGELRRAGPGIVEGASDGPLRSAAAIRLATDIGFPLPPVPRTADLARDVVSALASAQARATFHAFSGDRTRFRLAFVRGGHRRAVAWRCAELVRAELPGLVNDPRESTWEVLVDDRADAIAVELLPRGFADERFAYRVGLVAASSHPAIAAALARVAPRAADDIVWDPFAGAGTELIERARIGPFARLVGSDVDPRAVAAARANLARAGVGAGTIEEGDACTMHPAGVTCIITNPPMGRRVQRGTHADLLERFVAHAGRVLAPGGALVWIVPERRRIEPHAAKAGFVATRTLDLDMGGFSATLVVHMKQGSLVS